MSNPSNSDETPEKKTEDTGPEAETGRTEDVSDPSATDSDEVELATSEDERADEDDSGADDEATVEPEEDDDDTPRADVTAALATAPLVRAGADSDADVPEITAIGDDTHDLHEDDEEEHSRSFAAKVLTGLLLLLVGGGLALWAAPRIAPHLPSALDPVKRHLLPGESLSQTRIAALEAKLTDRIDGIVPGIRAEQAEALAAGAVAEAEDRLSTRVDEIAAEVTAMGDRLEAVDSASVEGRLAQMETRLEGLSAELSGLSALQTEGLSDEQLAELNQFQAAVEGLRAEVGTLADQQGALAQRIDDVEVAVQRRLDEADAEISAAQTEAKQVQSLSSARAALATIDAALASGEPYQRALEEVRANTDTAIPEGLAASAETGVTTLGALRSGFSDAAHQAIRAAIREGRDDGGVGGRVAAFLEAQVASRSLTPQEGDSADAILSRAEDALRQDNLSKALEELAALPDAARQAMGGWIDRAQARVAAHGGFAELNAALSAQN